MNILKILGIVAGIHVVAFFLMFVNPGCRSTSAAPTKADTLPAPAAAPAPVPAAAPSDAAPAPAVSVNIPARFTPTRPGTPASEALETAPLNDVTPATTYVVVRGDSLSKIAKKNHTTQAELMKTNHLTASSVLNIGQKLLIPGKAPAGAGGTGAGSTYTVKPGDTLASIAHRVGSTTAELKQLNNLRSDYVQVGLELKLPAGSAPVAEAVHNPPAVEMTHSPSAAPASVKTPEGAVTHEVKPGETVGAIARKYHVKTQDLLVANNIADPRKIRAGQVLVIPGGSASGATTSVTTSNPSATPSPAVRPTPGAPGGPAPATANSDTSAAPANATDLDAGAKTPADVPVIKVDDGSDTKTP